MVVQYLLVALVAFIASMDEQLFGITMLGRPLFTSLFVGLILGDVQHVTDDTDYIFTIGFQFLYTLVQLFLTDVYRNDFVKTLMRGQR